ncbi:ABC transporter permease [Nitriliruptoraceae bacterium ZYF776]|nr:ABC transporter permease [Profundirhabdus halotolerans]
MRWTITDALVVAGRNLTHIRRLPQLLVFATIQPVIFVLMFRYVFGGSIEVPGLDYVNYLMPGIFVQTVTFGATQTGVGLADDLQKGLIERFRTLPMARSAVLAGRTLSDLVRNTLVVALMFVVGLLVGFDPQTGLFGVLAAAAIVLFWSFAMSWITALVGLSMPDAESAQTALFPVLFPLVFASSAFVPTEAMPGWLQVWADNQPVSATVDAARAILLGQGGWAEVWPALAWSAAIVAVFAPLAIRRYRRV